MGGCVHSLFPASFLIIPMKKLLFLVLVCGAAVSARSQAVQRKTTATSSQTSAAGTARTTVRTHDVAMPSGNYHSSDKTHTVTTPAPAGATRKTAVVKRNTTHRTQH